MILLRKHHDVLQNCVCHIHGSLFVEHVETRGAVQILFYYKIHFNLQIKMECAYFSDTDNEIAVLHIEKKYYMTC